MLEEPNIQENSVLTFTSHSQAIHFYLPDQNDHIQKLILKHRNFYESEMLEDIRSRVSPGSLAIDVGANIGNHTIFLSKVCEMKVIALEPLSQCYDILTRNIELNGVTDQVTALRKAAGQLPGHGHTVVINPHNLGMTYVEEKNDGDVEIIRLDDLHVDSPVELLKIDVEKMSLDVIKGATRLIGQFHPLIYIELSEKELFNDVKAFLLEFGYWNIVRFNWTPTLLFMPVNESHQQFSAIMSRIDFIQRDLERNLDGGNEIRERLRAMEDQLDKYRKQSDLRIKDLQTQLEEKDKKQQQSDLRIKDLQTQLEEKDKKQQHSDLCIKDLQTQLEEKDKEIRHHKETKDLLNSQKSERIKQLEAQLKLKEQDLKRKQDHFLNSWSWRVTVPLRKVYDLYLLIRPKMRNILSVRKSSSQKKPSTINPQPLRILYILRRFPVVSQTFVLNEIIEMIRLGHDIRILSLLPPLDKIEHESFKEYGLQKVTSYAYKIFGDKKEDYKKLGLKILASFHADVIHAHFCDDATAIAMQLSKETGIPYIFSAHGFDIYVSPPSNWKERIDEAKACIVYSQYNRDFLIRTYNIDAQKIHLVRHGVDINKFKPSIQKYEIPTIVSVARLHPVKGNEYLVQACSILHAQRIAFQCLLIGDGEKHAELQQMITKLNLDEYVKLLGYKTQNQVAQILPRCHIHALPSLQESFGVANLEAMACGLPVVASDVQGIKELVRHNITGFLTEAGNPESLAANLKILLLNVDLREAFGAASRKCIENEYPLRKEAERTIEIWKRIQQGKITEVEPCGDIGDELPFVSVVVPAYNAERTMAKCIESLLEQTYDSTNYEIIIVDNDSKDKTADIVKSYPVKYVLEDKVKTSYGARNAGIKVSKGTIILFTDSDCIPESNWIAVAVEAMKDPFVGGVTGPTIDYLPENRLEKYIAQVSPLDCRPSFRPGKMPQAFTCNVAYRRRVFDIAGFFDSSMPGGGDVNMSWQMQLRTDCKLLFDETMVVKHKHRSTYKSVFKQQKRIGFGWVDVYVRYKNYIEQEPGKFLYFPSHYNRIIDRLKEAVVVLKVPFALVQTLLFHKDNTHIFYWATRNAARRIGRIKGCWRYKEWHLWDW